jgi:hypothetical protein
MSSPPPKTPQQIQVLLSDRDIEGGIAHSAREKEELSLAEVISRYLTRMGLESALASSIIVQLLTSGKVRVDFSTVVQRLQLKDPGDRMGSPEAMALFDAYAASLRTKEDSIGKGKTMRIMVQKPRQ